MKQIDSSQWLESLGEAQVFANPDEPGSLRSLGDLFAALAECPPAGLAEGARRRVMESAAGAAGRIGAILSLKNDTHKTNEIEALFAQVEGSLRDIRSLLGGGRGGAPATETPAEAGRSATADIDPALYAEYLDRQAVLLEDLEDALLRWEQGGGEARRDLLRYFHTLKGEAGLLSLPVVEALCHACETGLSAARRASENLPANESPRPAEVDLLYEAKDWLSRFFRHLAGRDAAPAAPDALIAALRGESAPSPAADPAPPAPAAAPNPGVPATAAIADLLPAGPASPPLIPEGVDPSLLADFISESLEHLEASEGHILSLEARPGDVEAMDAIFRAFHTIKGLAGFIGLRDVQALAHETESALDLFRKPSAAAAREESPVFPAGFFDLVFDSCDALKKMIRALRPQGPAAEVDLPPLLLRLRAVSQGNGSVSPAAAAASGMPGPSAAVTSTLPPAPPSPGVRAGGAEEAPGTASGKGPAESSRGAAGETVRVEAEKLDRLLDSIGELVIAESMIVQSPELMGKASGALIRQLGQLDKITRGLQEMGTSLRMVPVRPLFQKMARLVRDLAKKSGKAVEFAAEGEDTELDRTVVDRIGDPLVHMVRNSVDHGIEPDAEDRAARGKSRAATVRMRAFQKGGSVCIEVEDDGRGLNRQAILQKARERGLVKEGAALSDREVFDLIFEPGFSTAKTVTEISGRGVGMDVVKKTVEHLRGRIEIRSQEGRGTVFSIWLPLTLAIIDGMVVRVGEERYVFPTLSLLRMVPVAQKDILTVTGKGRMLNQQGRLVPLKALHQALAGSAARSDGAPLSGSAGAAGTAGSDLALALIVEVEGEQAGFLVDEVLGQQQIVIKGLGEAFKHIDSLSGGAILADGKVGLILDTDRLVKEAFSDSHEPAGEGEASPPNPGRKAFPEASAADRPEPSIKETV